MTWAAFWKWFLILSIGCYFLVAIAVAIGGYFGIRRMFQQLSSAPEESPTDQAE